MTFFAGEKCAYFMWMAGEIEKKLDFPDAMNRLGERKRTKKKQKKVFADYG